jgi:hypothetical protein
MKKQGSKQTLSLLSGLPRDRNLRKLAMKTIVYRVFFTIAPTTYYVVSAPNARAAVWRAKRTQRALRLNKRRAAPLRVARIERLVRAADGITKAVSLNCGKERDCRRAKR